MPDFIAAAGEIGDLDAGAGRDVRERVARARLGVWVEHREETYTYGEVRILARLTAEQAALDDRARDALFNSVKALFNDHSKKFHRQVGGECIVFAAPGGGGWLAAVGTKRKRFEGDAEAQLTEGCTR